MLRVAASRVPPLSLRLREGARYFQAGAHLLWGGGLVNDTTPAGEGNKEHILPFSTRTVVG